LESSLAKADPTAGNSEAEEAEEQGERSKAMMESGETEGGTAEGAEAEGAKAENNEEGGEENAHHILFYSMLAGALLLTGLVALTSSSDKVVAGNTWRCVEQVILVFIAVMWYQAFDDLLAQGEFAKHHETLYHCLHAAGLLVICVVVSYYLAHQKGTASRVRLAIFCGVAAHYVSFASMAAGKMAMHNHFIPPGIHFVGLAMILIVIVVIFVVLHWIKASYGMYKDEEWAELISDVENDFAAMAFAMAFHLWVMHLIRGTNYTNAEEGESHSLLERCTLLGYAMTMTIGGSLALKPVHKFLDANMRPWLAARFAMFFSSFVAMAAAWAFLSWGEWEFEEVQFQFQPLLGKLAFATAIAFVSGLVLVLMAKLLPRPTEDDLGGGAGWKGSAARIERVVLIAIALMVAWSWEETFDEAIEGWTEGDKNAHLHKIILAVGMAAVIIPVYSVCLQPIVHGYATEGEKETVLDVRAA
jgi:hypothetical protein